MRYDYIIESYINGQKKQAIQQFNDLTETEAVEFLVDNIINKTNDKLMCRLMQHLVEANIANERQKFIKTLKDRKK